MEEERDNPAGEGGSAVNVDELPEDSFDPILAETNRPAEQQSIAPTSTGPTVRTQSRPPARRLMVQRALETETASRLRRVGSEDLYDGFGHTVAGQCRNLPVDRHSSFMAFVHASVEIYSTASTTPVVEQLIAKVRASVETPAIAHTVGTTTVGQMTHSTVSPATQMNASFVSSQSNRLIQQPPAHTISTSTIIFIHAVQWYISKPTSSHTYKHIFF